MKCQTSTSRKVSMSLINFKYLEEIRNHNKMEDEIKFDIGLFSHWRPLFLAFAQRWVESNFLMKMESISTSSTSTGTENIRKFNFSYHLTSLNYAISSWKLSHNYIIMASYWNNLITTIIARQVNSSTHFRARKREMKIRFTSLESHEQLYSS